MSQRRNNDDEPVEVQVRGRAFDAGSIIDSGASSSTIVGHISTISAGGAEEGTITIDPGESNHVAPGSSSLTFTSGLGGGTAVTLDSPPQVGWSEYNPCGRQLHAGGAIYFANSGVGHRGKEYTREIRLCMDCYMEALEKQFQLAGVRYEVKDTRDEA